MPEEKKNHDELHPARHALTPARQGPFVIALSLAIAAALVGLLLLQVWQRVRIVQMGYELGQLTHERRQLLEERERLRLEASVELRTERLDHIARKDRGLTPVKPEQVIYVHPVRTARAMPVTP